LFPLISGGRRSGSSRVYFQESDPTVFAET
jgi:hypothetical protein